MSPRGKKVGFDPLRSIRRARVAATRPEEEG